jgi:hypothetical protein
MGRSWTEQDKQSAATELENARQNVLLLGSRVTRTDVKRVEKAEKHFEKVTGKKPRS